MEDLPKEANQMERRNDERRASQTELLVDHSLK
jgi:hypothetical protein